MMNLLLRNIEEATATFRSLAALDANVHRAADMLAQTLTSKGKLLACGNGGSAADAAHLTTEFVCRFNHDRPPYPAICLASHGGDLTAIGNDYAFEDVFARQVQAFAQPGDTLMVFSTSGRSVNIARALTVGRKVGARTIALLGRDGGACAGLADVQLIVPCRTTARIQEAHALLLHTICELVESRL
ncbi:MAG: SIS domain-containing protein [Phycisphaeraceae bacterium]|nr:SIS domain-containing protein [Phycisphaeraceae bacterium]